MRDNPLPWKVNPPRVLNGRFFVCDANGVELFSAPHEVAHQIVRAVNCHEGLVDAMKDAVSGLRYIKTRADGGSDDPTYGTGFDRVFDKATKALAACESEEEKKEPTDGR